MECFPGGRAYHSIGIKSPARLEVSDGALGPGSKITVEGEAIAKVIEVDLEMPHAATKVSFAQD